MTRFTSLIFAAACLAAVVGMPSPGEAHQSRFDNHASRGYYHQPRPRFDPQVAMLRMFFQVFVPQQFGGRRIATEPRHGRGGYRNRDRRRQHR